MATSTTFGNFGNSSGKNEIDLIDVGALIFLPFFASLIFGVFSVEIGVFSGYNFTDPIWTIGGADVSFALLAAVAAIAWVLGTNILNEQTSHEGYELGAIAVALLLPVGVIFIPAVESLVFWSDLMQLVAWLYVSGATVWISYVG